MAGYLSSGDNSGSYSDGANPSFSIALSAGANRRIVVFSGSEDSVSPAFSMTGATFGGSAMTQVGPNNSINGSASSVMDCWTLAIPDGWSGSKTFAATLTGGGGVNRGVGIVWIQVEDVDSGQTFDVADEKDLTTGQDVTTINGQIADVPTGAIVVSGVTLGEQWDPTADDGMTKVAGLDGTSFHVSVAYKTGASGATDVGWSYVSSSSRWASTALALKNATAPPASDPTTDETASPRGHARGTHRGTN